MDVQEMLEMMRDPLGAPFFPVVFQALLVVTWVLHIHFVTGAIGSSTFSIFAFLRKDPSLLRLGRITARLTPNMVGLGIVTGIAPLLFVQTIYDPLWYAANTLTGFWSVTFIFVVMGGYSLAYLFYLKGSQDGRLLWSAVASLILLCFAGWVMHVLQSVSIRPDQWMGWYAPGGVIDTRGIQFHAYDVPRLMFMLPLQGGLSFAATLMFVAWYLRQRADADPGFLHWTAGIGRRIGLGVAPLYGVFGLFWAFTEGPEFGLTMFIAGVALVLSVGLFAFFWSQAKQPVQAGARALGVWALALLVVATTREVIRAVSLNRFDFSVANYPYIIDWGSVLMFGVTSVVGVSVVTYLIMVIYQSGLSADGTVSVRAERFGRVATAMLGAWFGFFVLVGLYSSLFLR
jgi:hypothetical protein